jgi:hypothetical protein
MFAISPAFSVSKMYWIAAEIPVVAERMELL